jgi:hypothetical protein
MAYSRLVVAEVVKQLPHPAGLLDEVTGVEAYRS